MMMVMSNGGSTGIGSWFETSDDDDTNKMETVQSSIPRGDAIETGDIDIKLLCDSNVGGIV